MSACSAPAPLPPPGAEQGATLQLWRDDAPPLRCTVDQLRQLPDRPMAMALIGVEAVVPMADGTGELQLRAPQGRYDPNDTAQLLLPGPIDIAGQVNGQALLGRASQAYFDASSQSLVCRDILLITSRFTIQADSYHIPRLWQEAAQSGENLLATPTALLWQGVLSVSTPSTKP